MDHKEEYHDPDYPGTSESVKEEAPSVSEEERVAKIKNIIRREFSNELEVRENEIMLIDQRMASSRRMLHRLRYVLVSGYYHQQKLQLSAGQLAEELAAHAERAQPEQRAPAAAAGQRRLHPSVRKLLGGRGLGEVLRARPPRPNTRKDYSAMMMKRNYTVAADATKTLRPADKPEPAPAPEHERGEHGERAHGADASRPRKQPRHLEPRVDNVLTLDEATRNKMKHRYRIIIGNTSKYAPPASAADRSTHKWLLYVRAAPARAPAAPADVSRVVRSVTARLHHSYAPHHVVTLTQPPFHVSRRGWGEFAARVELHFALPERNPPAAVSHTIKLDRRYTGLQTLGAETIVDVWLYSTPEMLENAYVEDDASRASPLAVAPAGEGAAEGGGAEAGEGQEQGVAVVKCEPVDADAQDNWMDFFSKETTELDVDEMINKPIKSEPEIEENDTCNTEIEDFSNTMDCNGAENTTDIPNEILNQSSSPKKRIMKYIDPTTGKIYYLEMDRKLDLSKVQEIVINNTKAKISPIKSNGLKNYRKKKGVSLLKPEVQSLLKSESGRSERCASYAHIENDHCYLGVNWGKSVNIVADRADCTQKNVDKSVIKSECIVKSEEVLYDLVCASLCRLCSVRSAVTFLLRKIPLVDQQARDPDFVRWFPFVVDSEEKYWKLDFAKRRNIEWSRAKLINRLLTEHLPTDEPIWRTKQILIFSRLHGYYPIRPQAAPTTTEGEDWSSWIDLENSRKIESNIKELYPKATDIFSLSLFNPQDFDTGLQETIEIDSDEEIDIVCDSPVKVKREVLPECGGLTVLPVESEEDRLRFMFIERKCADIGVELRNEDVGNGYSYSAVHAVLLAATRRFADELLRSARAHRLRPGAGPPRVWPGWSPSRTLISLEHVYMAAGGVPPSGASGESSASTTASATNMFASNRLQMLCGRALAAKAKQTHAI